MSGPEHSDDDKGFLARWSQRKQEAKQPEPKPDAPAAEADAAASRSRPPKRSRGREEFDLSSLPKLEELTGTTDITAFLRKGVPEQSAQRGVAKILGARSRDPQLRQSGARICL